MRWPGRVEAHLFRLLPPGATAQEETYSARGLDLFIDYDPANRFKNFPLISIKQMLEEELQIPVDLTTRGQTASALASPY